MNTHNEGIAIIGMAGRFPGAADIDAFWDNLVAGRESTTFFTREQISSGVPPSLSEHPRYVRARGVLDAADRFDAGFFNIPEREALLIDPQQRVFLELCWNALEHASVDPDRYLKQDKSIGVYAGVSNNGYRKLVDSRADLLATSGEFAAMLANEKDYVATRVAYRLGLTGPALSLHTACSTSLVAIAQAWYALMSWQCDVAIAGGINVVVPQDSGYLPVEGGMESSDGHCRPFDARADGTVFSSGGAAIVLKRMSDAVADGDRIWAVLRGVGVNNDGADKASFTSPSARGQAAAVRLALASAGVSAQSIGYVEAHGTGTPLGDPIEIEALTRAFAEDAVAGSTVESARCLLGSVKGNFGHLVAASGVAGLIKTVLALHHGVVPATLHYEQANPEIEFSRSPFEVAARPVDWPRGNEPRRAGVSSFGVGGTNAHVIVEEAPLRATRPAAGRPIVLPVSARDEAGFVRRCAQLQAVLSEQRDLNLADLGWTLATGRQAMAVRGAVVVDSVDEARDLLGRMTPRPVGRKPGLVFVFPGQGAQHANIARGLVDKQPVFREALQQCCTLATARLDRDLYRLILPAAGGEDTANVLLAQTRYTQPALFAVEYALTQLWQSCGIEADTMIGHSIGEYVAACVAGVFTLEDAIALVVARGAAMHAQPAGAMLAVRSSEAALAARLPRGIEIAASNAPQRTVVAGSIESIRNFARELADERIATTELQVSHAFHSAMMENALPQFRQAFAGIQLNAPKRAFYSGVSGNPIEAHEATSIEYWCLQLRAPVRFAQAVMHALVDANTIVLEVGPRQQLSGLIRSMRPTSLNTIASLPAADEADDAVHFSAALGKLWCAGIEPDWDAYFDVGERQRIALPGYPFAGKRYWIDPPVAAASTQLPFAEEARDAPVHSVLAGNREIRESSTSATEPTTRMQRFRAEVRELFESISGNPIPAEQDALAFLELGLDSLGLTQAMLEIERRYKVRLKFRRLMEDLHSVAHLASWLDQNLPADADAAMPPPQSPMPAEETAPADLRERPFGAAARITTGIGHELDAGQSAWLQKFAARYTARTAKSKAFTQHNRELMADPRAVTGFNPLWKELVYPIVADRSLGARLWDIDGNEYIDLLNGFGANFLGSQPDYIAVALKDQIDSGFEIGPQHPLAADVAQLISDMTGMPRVAFCNTGSEAVMGAMRIARTVTGRSKIVIFTNSYHGIFDEVIVRGTRRLRSIAAAPGILASSVENVLVLDYGSEASLQVIRENASDLAAVMIEPVQGRNPTLQPHAFVQALREICDAAGCALIFDEVITGFRIAQGGAQEFYDVRADLATYGKIIGGGLPFAAIAGSSHWMDALDGGSWRFGDESQPPAGVTYFAGTFVRHPLALAAAKAALLHLKSRGPALQREISERTGNLISRLNAAFAARGAPIHAAGFSSLWRLFVAGDQPCADLFFYALRERGLHVYAQFNCFLTDAHRDAEVDAIVERIDAVVVELMSAGVLSTLPVARSQEVAAAGSIADPTEQSRSIIEVTPTDAQLEKWLACQFGSTANTAFNESVLLYLNGHLDRVALEQTLALVTRRHEAFAASFSASGEQLRIGPRQCVKHVYVDLAIDGASGDARLQAHCAAALRRPFDLTLAPLMRLELIRISATRHALFVVAHHLIFDGWSASVFLQEIATAYKFLVDRKPLQLAPSDSLADFVQAEHARRGRSDQPQQLAYWMELHAQAALPLQLPADRSLLESNDFSADTLLHEFSSATSQAFYQLAARARVTPYAAMLAGFAVLLARLSGQRDFVIGIPFAAQAVTGHRHIIGDGVNTLPLRIAVADEDTFDALAQRCQVQLLDAADHQDATLYTLARASSAQQRREEIFHADVIFNLNPRVPTLDFGPLQYDVRDSVKVASVWQLFFNLNETARGITLGLHYSVARFDAVTIERWIGHYECLLLAAAGSNDRVSQLSILSRTQLESLRRSWRETERPYDRQLAVSDVIADCAMRFPDRIAVESGRSQLTYARLIERAQTLARSLIARGVRPNDAVGICLPRSVDLLTATLGVWICGASYVPLDAHLPAQRLHEMIGASVLRHVLVSAASEVPQVIADSCALHVLSELVATSQPKIPLPRVSGEQMAYTLFTSGSTGQPKGVCVTHRNLHNFLLGMQDLLKLNEQDILCAVTTLSFDIAGLELYLPLLAGARVVIADDAQYRDPDNLAMLLDECKATLLQTTPSMVRLLIAGDKPRDFSRLRLLIGGEEMTRDLSDRLVGVCRELWNLYGPTETTIWSVAAHILPGVGAIPLGKPIANTRVYLLDAQQNPVAPGVRGEIWIAGDGVADRYLNDPLQTEQRFRPDPFHSGAARMYRSGDIGSLSGDVLFFHGRVDTQIKLRGFRIEPSEIETLARLETGVRDAVALVLDLGNNDRRLTLYVAAPGAARDVASSIRERIRQTLPTYMLPQHIEVLDLLPQTASGKIDRKALPLPLLMREPVSSTKPDETASAMEKTLAAIWCELLGVAHVGIHDNFFDVGGDSLLGVHLFHRIQSLFGVNLPLSTLFSAPTVAEQARQFSAAGAGKPKTKSSTQIATKSATDPWALLVPIQPQGARPPLLCVHSMGGNVLNYLPLARALGKDQPFYGLQALGLDGTTRPLQSLRAMAAAYKEAIRKRFPHGPYFLAGGSMGGMIAFELAQQLLADGEEIGLLAMFDTYGPTNRFFEIQHAGSLERMQVRWQDRWVRARKMGAAGRWRMLTDAMNRRLQRGSDLLRIHWHRTRGDALPHEVRYRELEAINLRAYYNYSPGSYSGAITLFRAMQQPPEVALSRTLGWDGIAEGGISIIDLPGTHDTLIEQPALSAALGAVLRRAQDAATISGAPRQGRA